MEPTGTITAAPDFVEVSAPVTRPTASNAEALFAWMQVNRYLWMLEGGEPADELETKIGTPKLIALAGMRFRWMKKNRDPATNRAPKFTVPEAEDERERAYSRLDRFLEMQYQSRRELYVASRDSGRVGDAPGCPTPGVIVIIRSRSIDSPLVQRIQKLMTSRSSLTRCIPAVIKREPSAC